MNLDDGTQHRLWARAGAAGLTNRLSPEVMEIVRLDLVQTVGNFLRHVRNEKVELESIAEMANVEGWGDW